MHYFLRKKKTSYNKSLKDLYIPSSKIYFELESNNSILFSQIFPKNKNEQAYILNYKFDQNTKKISNKEDIKLYPALFIFLILYFVLISKIPSIS